MAKRILVVDDQPAARELLRAVLTTAGYEVYEAVDGADALERAAECSPDLILLDIQMPNLDGFGACRAFRASPRFAGLPIVAMTASLMNSEKDRACEVGFSDFLPKPIALSTLRKTVAGLLGES